MNKATRISVATLGSIFGLSGMSHGFFEILQGNASNRRHVFAAIGEAQKMWPHGDEYAFSLIPNFLITGIVAMLVSLTIVVWSIGFTRKKHGSTILFFSSYCSFWLGEASHRSFSSHSSVWFHLASNKPLNWWRKVLPVKIHKRLENCGRGACLSAHFCLYSLFRLPSLVSCQE